MRCISNSSQSQLHSFNLLQKLKWCKTYLLYSVVIKNTFSIGKLQRTLCSERVKLRSFVKLITIEDFTFH